jgi:methylmalonyl-CoA mutase N-terminal domain/subunit
MSERGLWRELARKELRGRDPDELIRETPDGLRIRPLYTAEDLEGLEHVGTLPGLFPFLRGPRATMYANRPWTVRQYGGPTSPRASRACRSPSISPLTAATTRTIPGWWATSARPAWQSTPSRT